MPYRSIAHLLKHQKTRRETRVDNWVCVDVTFFTQSDAYETVHKFRAPYLEHSLLTHTHTHTHIYTQTHSRARTDM